jgi:hypothetical protein
MLQPLQMRSYIYVSAGIIVASVVLIGTGAGLGISGLVLGGILCLIVGALVGFLSGIRP